MSDDEIDHETLALLDSQAYLAARTLSRWMIWGAALTAGSVLSTRLYPWVSGGWVAVVSILLGSSEAQIDRALAFNYGAYAFISIGALVVWIAYGGAGMVRYMKTPASALDNRLILSLKRGVAGPQTIALLESLPADSAYRLYLAPVMKRLSRRA